MPSPFPGMDPYLEGRHLWPSVHHRLIGDISDVLTAQVAPHFYVTIEERVYITSPDEDDMPIVPDVYLVQPPSSTAAAPSAPRREPTAFRSPDQKNICENPSNPRYLRAI